MKSALKKFFTSTKFLTMGLIYTGLAIFFLGMTLYKFFFVGKFPEKDYTMFLVMIMSLFATASGVFCVIRRERPQYNPFIEWRGTPAVVSGVLWIIFYGSGFFVLLLYFLGLLEL